jgi:hypothetical protein
MIVFLSIAFGLLAIAATGVTVWALLRAPVGIEDESGFHLGISPKRAESARVRSVTQPVVFVTPLETSDKRLPRAPFPRVLF